ncbi:hypothetical protein [Devosia sp.]|jgi:hypothetical protein|uniref:hypothetical protein n=1 Tax=Devosia sp. TaxID=1871048 RepID=UPI0037C13059
MRTMLDPSDPITKKLFKGSIADGVMKDVMGSDRDEIVRRDEAESERILSHAHFFTSAPAAPLRTPHPTGL